MTVVLSPGRLEPTLPSLDTLPKMTKPVSAFHLAQKRPSLVAPVPPSVSLLVVEGLTSPCSRLAGLSINSRPSVTSSSLLFYQHGILLTIDFNQLAPYSWCCHEPS